MINALTTSTYWKEFIIDRQSEEYLAEFLQQNSIIKEIHRNNPICIEQVFNNKDVILILEGQFNLWAKNEQNRPFNIPKSQSTNSIRASQINQKVRSNSCDLKNYYNSDQKQFQKLLGTVGPEFGLGKVFQLYPKQSQLFYNLILTQKSSSAQIAIIAFKNFQTNLINKIKSYQEQQSIYNGQKQDYMKEFLLSNKLFWYSQVQNMQIFFDSIRILSFKAYENLYLRYKLEPYLPRYVYLIYQGTFEISQVEFENKLHEKLKISVGEGQIFGEEYLFYDQRNFPYQIKPLENSNRVYAIPTYHFNNPEFNLFKNYLKSVHEKKEILFKHVSKIETKNPAFRPRTSRLKDNGHFDLHANFTASPDQFRYKSPQPQFVADQQLQNSPRFQILYQQLQQQENALLVDDIYNIAKISIKDKDAEVQKIRFQNDIRNLYIDQNDRWGKLLEQKIQKIQNSENQETQKQTDFFAPNEGSSDCQIQMVKTFSNLQINKEFNLRIGNIINQYDNFTEQNIINEQLGVTLRTFSTRSISPQPRENAQKFINMKLTNLNINSKAKSQSPRKISPINQKLKLNPTKIQI